MLTYFSGWEVLRQPDSRLSQHLLHTCIQCAERCPSSLSPSPGASHLHYQVRKDVAQHQGAEQSCLLIGCWSLWHPMRLRGSFEFQGPNCSWELMPGILLSLVPSQNFASKLFYFLCLYALHCDTKIILNTKLNTKIII